MSLEAVKLISKAVKDSKYPSPADAVRSLATLKLEQAEATATEKALEKAKAKAATKASRGQRANEKREMDQALNRTQDEIEKSLREADAG